MSPHPRWMSPVLSVLVLLLLARSLQAQKPRPGTDAIDPPTPTWSVAVTPDGTTLAARPVNSSPFMVIFTVKNTGNQADTFTLSCSGTIGITCQPVNPSSIALSPGISAAVKVWFSTGSTSGTGRLNLNAIGTSDAWNNGYFNQPVTGNAGPPVVTLRNHNRDNVDRSLCLTAGAGEAAAWGCGDLVITHGMPGFITMGRERALTLIYNSGTAYPRPAIAAAVTQPNSAPVTVFAQLVIGGVLKDSASYAGWAGGAQQIVIDFNGAGLATGAYPMQLRVQNRYSSSMFETVVNDTLLIVNRFVDEYGAGFGIAGLEQLFIDQPVGSGHILWVGGDGSAKLYRKLTATTWQAPPGAFRETLALSGGVYTRTLRHGIQVKFSGSGLTLGRHIATVNRAGQQTTFTWSAAGNRLISIQVPPACGFGQCTYTLAWDVNNNLDYIMDPANRKLDATFAFNDGRLSSLRDPDGGTVSFGWDGDRRIISRNGRRGFTTTYEYSLGRPVGSRISKVTVPIGRVLGDNATAVTVFDAWNDKGLAVAITNQVAVDTGQAFTKIFGPRPSVADDASFWVDRWGAPTKIVNAIGVTTTIVRGDAANPGLVTKVTYPNNRIATMVYNSRGNLTQVRDSTSHLGATGLPTKATTYTYGSAATPDSPTQVSDALGRTARYNYTGFGLTDSVIDPRGHRTKFLYDSTSVIKGVVTQIIERAVETWRQSDSTVQTMDLVNRFAYDTKGNSKVDTAANKTVTSYLRNLAGRVVDVYDALGTHRTWIYDPVNRVTQAIQYPTADPNPYGLTLAANCDATQVVCTDQTQPFNPVLSTQNDRFQYGSLADTILDTRNVRRTFDHDARDLVWRETDDLGAARTARYGVAGTLDTSTTRAGTKVIYQYDLMARRTQMQIPKRVFDGACSSGTSLCSQADTIPAETITYTYDSLANPLTASGARGVITRRYYEDGSLRMKISSISGLAPDTLIYNYDASGARTRLIHARDIRDTTDYVYNPGSGDLDSMIVRYGPPLTQKYSFRFFWDGLGRRKQVLYPVVSGTKRMSVTLSYDAAGSMRRLRSAHPDSLSAVSNRLNFTFRNERVDAVGRILKQATTCRMLNNADVLGSPCSGTVGPDSATNGYNRFSMLVKRTHVFGSTNAVDSMGYDASGNMVFQRDGVAGVFHSFAMVANSNRLATDTRSGHVTAFSYTPDGSRLSQGSSSLFYDDLWHYYDGLERVSGNMRWDVQAQAFLIDNPTSCLYDPEGQMTKPCDNGAPMLGFEGHNVIAAGASPNLSWGFIHGPGVDDPLMGLARWATGNKKIFFWVTDGQGRQFSFADSAGRVSSGDYNQYSNNGGKYAGGTSAASSFQADRFSTPEVPGISFFRNRAYDRNTGRWTQEDPIGVAGGLNLYQFNGNNPVSYIDPFGLCKRPGGTGVGVCIESFIKGSFAGVGDNRGASSTGGSFKTSVRFSVNPGTSEVSGYSEGVGSTNGMQGTGSFFMTSEGDGQGGTNVRVTGNALNGIMAGPEIDFDVSLNVSADGEVTVTGGRHDGFPSYEIFSYPGDGGEGKAVYTHDQGNILELFGRGDVYVP